MFFWGYLLQHKIRYEKAFLAKLNYSKGNKLYPMSIDSLLTEKSHPAILISKKQIPMVGAAIQTMESLYILATSKNIETIKGRYDFILTLIPTLRTAKSNSQYSAIIQTALGQFKTMYPTSVPQEYQLSVLSNPETFDLN